MTRVTAIVITFNEAANIGAALASLSFADEIIVVDSQSTDDTVAIARTFTDKVIVRPWPGYIEQKNFAAAQASHDWILSLDADERVSGAAGRRDSGLAEGAVAGLPDAARHLSPGPLAALHRLVSRLISCGSTTGAARAGRDGWSTSRSRPTARSSICTARSCTTPTGISRITCRRWIATPRWPRARCSRTGGRAGWWDLAVHPPAAFLRNYVLRGGFRDGVPGLIVSAMNARYVGLKFAKLWELCSASTSTPPGPGAADSSKRS